MRIRRYVAAGTGLLVSAGTLLALPTAAQAAASGSVLYVRSSPGCSDETADSSVTPYCTIQAAADVVEPGQTVKIGVGTYNGGVTVTRSGTASAPIKFVGDGSAFDPSNAVTMGDAYTLTSGYALKLVGVSNVEISNIAVRGESTGAVYLTGASNVEVDHDYVVPYGTSGIEIAGGSTAVTAVDNLVFDAQVAFQVDAGVSGTTISNDISDGSAIGAKVDGASGTAVTGDTFADLATSGVEVSGGATGTTVENNVVYSDLKYASGVEVDAASAVGTRTDYDLVYTSESTRTYSWAGTTYASATAFAAATGQGTHDVNVAPGISSTFTPTEGSPAINSGDAAAPGEPATDFYGNPRALDPHDPVTGTGGGYYGRGAVQILDPIAVSLDESSAWAAGSVTQTFTTALTTAPWSPSVTYTYDFGDGTTNSTTTSTVTHTYSTAGTYTVKVTAVDADHGSATATADFELAGGNAYYPISPTRVLDTRHAIGTPTGRVPANGTVTLKLGGVGGVPATGAVAVVLNVTVVNPSANGVITVYPDATTAPTASNLNFLHGENRPNLVTVKLGTDGSVKLRNGGNGTADLIADLEGYYAPGTGTGFVGVQNHRYGPTSLTVGKPQTLMWVATSANQLAAGAAALVLNVTVTKGTASGYLSAYPDDAAVPTASNVNYSTNENIANMVIVPLGKDGYFNLIAGGKPGATVTAIVDVEGFYTSQPGTGATGFVPTQPTRLIDTRNGLGTTTGPTSDVQVDPVKLAGIPAHAAGIAANVTAVAPQANGFLTAYSMPELSATSTLNFTKGQNVANLAQLAWTPDTTGQRLNLDTHGVSTDMVLDMFGYFVN